MTDIIDLLSNNLLGGPTPEKLRHMGVFINSAASAQTMPLPSEPFTVHRLSARLRPEQIEDIVGRYEASESATAIAKYVGGTIGTPPVAA